MGMYIPNAQIDSIAAGTMTSLLRLANAQHGIDHFRNLKAGIYRPGAATSADYWRTVGALTIATGVLANSSNWTDTTLGTEDFYLPYHGINPADSLDTLNQTMGLNYFPNSEPLSAKPSGTTIGNHGFQSPTLTMYTESDADGGPTTGFTNVTTADSDNVWGASIGSGRVLNTAANGYIRQRFSVTRGEQVFVWAIARPDGAFTASLTLWDVTNNVQIGTAVTTTETQWQYMWRTENVPSTCEVMEIRLQGVEATADIKWGAKSVMRTQNRRIQLDSTWDRSFKIKLMYGKFHGSGNSNGVIDAHSLDLTEIPESDYDFDMQPPGANPRWVQLHTTAYNQYPIWIQGRRAYSDLTTFTLALSETTACDLDLLESCTRWLLFREGGRASHVTGAPALAAAAKIAFDEARSQFRKETPQIKRRPMRLAHLRN